MAADGDILERYVGRADVPWEERDGVALVVVPRARSRFERAIARVLRAPESVAVRLDALGTEAWRLADGTRTGRAIAEALAASPEGADSEPRLRVFLATLDRHSLVRLTDAPRPADDPFAGFPANLGFRVVACPRCGHATRAKGPSHLRLRCPACRRIVRAVDPGTQGP